MKVALVFAGLVEGGFNTLSNGQVAWMNHGLAILSAAVKQAGHEVTLLDLRRMTGWDDFARQAAQTDATAFGITMMSVDFDAGLRCARSIRQSHPDAKIFVGGPHPSICPEELLEHDCFDVIVQGEGEVTFPKLLADLAQGKPLPRVVRGEFHEDLDRSPWADRELFGRVEAPLLSFLPPPFVTLIAGRGCMYACRFCQPAERIIFGRRVRRRSVDNVLAELANLRDRFHFNSYMIHDDCITEDRDWVMAFCRRVREEGFTQPFIGQSRADIICRNPDMVEALRDAGLKLFIVGFESGSDRVLKFLRKGCTREQNIQAAAICRERGVKVWANYMFGVPTETNAEALETLHMLEEIEPYYCSPTFYTPHPGSDLFNWGKEQGIHVSRNHDIYRRGVFEPKIQGPDYAFLTTVLYKSLALAGHLRDSIPAPADAPGPSPADAHPQYARAQRLRLYLLNHHPHVYRALRRVRSLVRSRKAG